MCWAWGPLTIGRIKSNRETDEEMKPILCRQKYDFIDDLGLTNVTQYMPVQLPLAHVVGV